MIVLLFGWLLDRANGLMTHAIQRRAPMGIRYFIFMVISGHIPQNGHKTNSLYN
jgi:hypothetical protein